MRALTWQGKRSVAVEAVPDPTIQAPTDAIDRAAALLSAIKSVRRGGTVSVSGVYGT